MGYAFCRNGKDETEQTIQPGGGKNRRSSKSQRNAKSSLTLEL